MATVDATPGTLVVIPRFRLSPSVLAVEELVEDALAASAAVPRGAARPAPLHRRGGGGRRVASRFSCVRRQDQLGVDVLHEIAYFASYTVCPEFYLSTSPLVRSLVKIAAD